MKARLLSHIFKPILTIVFCFLSFCFLQGDVSAYTQNEDLCDAGDLLGQAFCPAKSQGTIIDMGNNPNTVGNEILKGSTELSEKGFSKDDPIFTRIVKFFLILTIVLSVTMIIINGITYITKSNSGEDPAKSRRNLLYIAIGIVIALMATTIITIFQSAGNDLQKITVGGEVIYGGVVNADLHVLIPKEGLESDYHAKNSDIQGTSDIWNSISEVNGYLWRIIGFVCFIFLLYNGTRLIMARGEQKDMQSATKGLLGSTVGIAICVLSYSLVRIIVNLL
ncbi:hypothetical protein AGMMS50249_4420 [candidate division SR1 bacterium]|nr:hypothetical protein AGMMS50249_4420 [candidate division SR1 bacterium]